MDLAKLALSGLIGGTLTLGACGGPAPVSKDASATKEAAGHDMGGKEMTGHDMGGKEAAGHEMAGHKMPDHTMAKTDGEQTFSEIHDCAGKNSCKGLGGCKVTAEMKTQMGLSGDPHDCKGMNSCKGLGGCAVDAEKLAAIKAMKAEGGAAK